MFVRRLQAGLLLSLNGPYLKLWASEMCFGSETTQFQAIVNSKRKDGEDDEGSDIATMLAVSSSFRKGCSTVTSSTDDDNEEAA
ncbi:hypothetical protein QYF36_002432 [Acer negundo]|nr:hypothetical protein QYF36_002432 [Acer negundo]